MICLSNYEIKAKLLSKSFILCQTHPFEDIFASIDMTKAEQARHKLLVKQLKSWRARGETNIIIHRDSIVTRSKFKDSKLRSRNLEVFTDISSLYQAIVDPDYLCHPQVIQTMIKTPECLFLNKYCYLLYYTIMCSSSMQAMPSLVLWLYNHMIMILTVFTVLQTFLMTTLIVTVD